MKAIVSSNPVHQLNISQPKKKKYPPSTHSLAQPRNKNGHQTAGLLHLHPFHPLSPTNSNSRPPRPLPLSNLGRRIGPLLHSNPQSLHSPPKTHDDARTCNRDPCIFLPSRYRNPCPRTPNHDVTNHEDDNALPRVDIPSDILPD